MPNQTKRVSGPCPTFFRALCRTASEGGTGGYKWAGYGLTGHISGGQLMPDDLDSEEWQQRVEALEEFIIDRDDDAVLSWLDANLPRCMALVPTDRREAFLSGIYHYVLEEEQSLF